MVKTMLFIRDLWIESVPSAEIHSAPPNPPYCRNSPGESVLYSFYMLTVHTVEVYIKKDPVSLLGQIIG